GNLLLSGTGSFALPQANMVGTLAANVGSALFNNNQALTIGTVQATSGIAATGAVTVTTTAGNLTIAATAPVTGASAVLATAAAFINNAGSNAVATAGRWLIYSNAPTGGGEFFGGLNSADTAIWNATYATLPPASVTASGNRYLFATPAQTLTFTSTNASKTYGTDATSLITGDYAIAGYQLGVANAFLSDTAANVFSGAPAVTSTGAAAGASVAGGPYAISIAQGTLSALSGYAFSYVSNGQLAVIAAPVSVTAVGGFSAYGSSPANPGLSATGLQNGQTAAALTGLSNSFGISNASNTGSYTLNVAGTLTNSNYSIAGLTNGTWTVNAAPVTVTALGGSSTYGSSPANPGLSATGLQNGDTVSALTGLGNSFGISNTSNAGSYTLSVAGTLTNSNYTVASTTSGSWTVNAASVNVTALTGSSTYGSLPANAGLSATGLQNGDTVSVLTGLSNGITGASNAGSYTANVTGTLTNPNYTVGSTTSGSWTVNPAPVTVTALGGSSIYGASPSNPGLSATGLQNGQNASALTGLGNSFGISNISNAGSYALNAAGTLTNSNYTVASTNTGSWTVNPASVSVTALGGASTYGSSPPNPGLSATGLQNGENVSVLSGLRNSFDVTGSSSAGSYPLNVAGTLANPNYAVASTNSGSWIVNPVSALRGSLPGGSSPSIPGSSPSIPGSSQYIPGLSVPVQSSADAGVLSGLANAAAKVDAENGSASGRGASPARAGAGLPAFGPTPQIFPASPAPVSVNAPVAVALPQIAANSSPIPNRPCPDGDAGDAANGAMASDSGVRSDQPSRGCGAAVPNKPRGLIGFALSKLNRDALVKAIDREFSEVTNVRSSARVALTFVMAGTSLGLSAGIIGWLLRG
ncbi:beta strand repeat-containing protein, partial [Bradyrhizobium sp.]|uniref:beta strand repeat-containing protein n=1 Tax=Bradyrhizobium sp. TaxID=376 RepID=UPI003C17059C